MLKYIEGENQYITQNNNNHRRKELWVQVLDLCKNTVKFFKNLRDLKW